VYSAEEKECNFMAITSLISGEIRNKVGGMVGAKWKGKNYVRAYVIPKNPNTANQQLVRGNFKIVSEIGSQINPFVLKPYTAKTFKNMSPMNRFTQLNAAFIQAVTADLTKLVLFSGSALAATASAGSAVPSTGIVKVTFTPPVQLVTPDVYKYIVVAANTTTGVATSKIDTAVGGTPVPALEISLPSTIGDKIAIMVAMYTESTVDGQLVKANSNTSTLSVVAAEA
jgi:hypothetical protein